MTIEIINNKILSGLISEFEENFSLKNVPESKSLERFVNYTIMSKIDPEAFSDISAFDQVNVDANGTFGIDAFGLFANDAIILDKSDLDVHRKAKRLDIRFVFIQTKRSTSVDSGDLLKFSTAVKNIFSENPKIPLSEEMKVVKSLIDEVYSVENARLFAGRKPVCELYFVTTGQKISDSNIMGIISSEESSISNMIPDVGNVKFNHIHADLLIDLYNEVENRYSTQIKFDRNIPCPPMNDVEQAFIGYLPISEFLNIITATDGSIRKNIFYENVRDFQGIDNTVNGEIGDTISDNDLVDKFIILNNGVTIVARDFSNIRSTEYTISDYYIVNGCQTSNVLFKHKDRIKNSDSLHIPIKFIHTTSNELISKLIRSTNRQTPVPDEAFVSLEKFHKRLQDFYRIYARDTSEPIFYERRSKEYLNDGKIERTRIVNLHAQIRSFTAIILGEPHLVMSNNPSSILKEHKGKMFIDGHTHMAYYLSSLLLMLFQRQVTIGNINKKYVISRYWICWISRIIAAARIDVGPLNSQHTDNDLKSMTNWVLDEKNSKSLFVKSTEIFDDCRREYIKSFGSVSPTELIRRRAFRDSVKSKISREILQKHKKRR